MPEAIPVCLQKKYSYAQPQLEMDVQSMLDSCAFSSLRGKTILVKPNLLLPKGLACPDPGIVAAACAWFLDHGARLVVADSPGFGKAPAVARAIGLEEQLKPLGLVVESLNRPKRIRLPLPADISEKPIYFHIARQALDCDMILSIARVKAHSQMRITLSVKNCYGCVPGLRKAVYHALYGADRKLFAACLAALWAALPPVSGLLDGIVAMTETGPSKGLPFRMNLLAASSSALELDKAVMAAINLDCSEVPLHEALARIATDYPDKRKIFFPFAKPEDFHVEGFKVPQKLASASFNPVRLLKSCLKRIWKSL